MFGARFFSARYWSSRYWSSVGLTVTYAGAVILPMINLRTLIASTTEFQTWTGTANATAAKARIVIGAADSLTRPGAVISVAELGIRKNSGGASSFYFYDGALRVLWEDDVTAGDTQEEAEDAFLGDIDTIMSAALDASGASDAISLESFGLEHDPSRSDEDETDDYYQARTLARWSP